MSAANPTSSALEVLMMTTGVGTLPGGEPSSDFLPGDGGIITVCLVFILRVEADGPEAAEETSASSPDSFTVLAPLPHRYCFLHTCRLSLTR